MFCQVSDLLSRSCDALAACIPLLQAKRPQLRTWLDRFGEVYSKAVIAATLGLLGALLAAGVPLLGAAGQVRRTRH